MSSSLFTRRKVSPFLVRQPFAPPTAAALALYRSFQTESRSSAKSPPAVYFPGRSDLRGDALERFDRLFALREAGNVVELSEAIDSYLRLDRKWHNRATHELAIRHLCESTSDNRGETYPDKILEVYRQLMEDGGSPSIGAVEQVLDALCYREIFVERTERFIDRRRRRRKQIGKLRVEKFNKDQDLSEPGDDRLVGRMEMDGIDLVEGSSGPSENIRILEEDETLERMSKEGNLDLALRIFDALCERSRFLKKPLFDRLLRACSNRRPLDDTIRVFTIAETCVHGKPGPLSYAILIKAHGVARDLQGVRQVFDEFEAQRLRGSFMEDDGRRSISIYESVKHGYRVVPKFLVRGSGPFEYPVTSVWTKMIEALFGCGQTDEAVQLFERMLTPPVDGEPAPSLSARAHLPPKPSQKTVYNLFRGLASVNDYDNAVRWFRRLASLHHDHLSTVASSDPATTASPSHMDSACYMILALDAGEAGRVHEMNLVYSQFLDDASQQSQLHIRVSEQYFVMDCNLLEVINPTTSIKEADDLLETTMAFKRRFLEICSMGKAPGLPVDFIFGHGMIRRLMGALVYRGRFKEAFAEFASLVASFQKQGGALHDSDPKVVRKARVCVASLASLASGFVVRPFSGSRAPDLKSVIDIYRIVLDCGWPPSDEQTGLLTSLYLQARTQQTDLTALDWRAVVHAVSRPWSEDTHSNVRATGMAWVEGVERVLEDIRRHGIRVKISQAHLADIKKYMSRSLPAYSVREYMSRLRTICDRS